METAAAQSVGKFLAPGLEAPLIHFEMHAPDVAQAWTDGLGDPGVLFSHALPGEEAFITNSLASREIIPRFTFQAAGSSAYLVDLNW